MGAHHEDLTRRFAAKNIDRFDGLDYEQRRGCPALGDALAWIDCELQTEHEAGDHTIVVADVVELEAAADHIPLVFFRGRYVRLHLDDA
jgi:flavin reductase (DIM6/NTAB) family NADH-FMN oxidoreductase RutF